MDNPPHETAEFTNDSTTNDPQSASCGSGMFTGNQGFTVTGGTFTNTTNHPITRVPSDFRMIPLGDINLQHEMQVDRGVVGRRRGRGCVRRVYSAKVEGRNSDFTVAMYQGNGAEEEWRQQLAKYMSLRHPNIVQIYGAASSGGIHATLFHDDLVPLQQYVDTDRYSHFETVYLYACWTADFSAATNHVYFMFQRALHRDNYTAWIRHPSGQLCVELVSPSTPQPSLYYYPAAISRSQRISSASDTELMVVETLTTNEYHDICFLSVSQFRTISISTSTTVNLGAIIACSSDHPFESPVEIAYRPNVDADVVGWWTSEGAVGVVREDGWMRFKANNVFNCTIKLLIWNTTSRRHWLSQANNIFHRLRITSNFEDYVCVREVSFELEVSGTTEEPSAGFLFLCPPEDFKTGPSSFQWPDCPAYWSLDPSGGDRPSTKAETGLGFPSFHCTTQLRGKSWDASVYDGLKKFHRAKGFDPDSLEVARHLGNPLFELSSEVNSLFAHVNEGDFPSAEESDAESQVSSAPSTSSVAGSRSEPLTLYAEMLALSGTLKLLMIAQLVLLLFLGLSWLYEWM